MVIRVLTLVGVLFLVSQSPAQAQDVNAKGAEQRPVAVEGVVPDQATKARILQTLRGVYGDARVVDRIQVEAIPAPPNWGEYVAAMITPGLKRVSGGKLEVNGQAVRISGQVTNEAQRQQVASDLSLASNTSYTVTNALHTNAAGQNILDQTLANRIIEFQSGSSNLTPLGMGILDEMLAKMTQMPDARFLVIGHTDNVGSRESNLALSYARAEAVRTYLAQKGLQAKRVDILGKGPDEPTADNATADGRARNRRIEFRIQ